MALALTAAFGQSELEFPLIFHVTVPLGTVGVNVTPVRVAVNVTEVPTGTGFWEAVMVSVGVSAVTEYVKAAEVAVLKLESLA